MAFNKLVNIIYITERCDVNLTQRAQDNMLSDIIKELKDMHIDWNDPKDMRYDIWESIGYNERIPQNIIEYICKNLEQPLVYHALLKGAVFNANINRIKYLIDDLCIDYDKEHLLDCALSNTSLVGMEAVIVYFIKKGADIHYKNDKFLRRYARNCEDKFVKLFLENSDVWSTRLKSDSLCMSIKHGCKRYETKMMDYPFIDCFETIKLLVKAGADIHCNNEEPLRESAKRGHLPVVKLLVESGADITANNNEALLKSAKNDHLEVVKYLLENGADIHVLFNDGLVLKSLGDTVKIYLIKTFDIMDPIKQQIAKEMQIQHWDPAQLTIPILKQYLKMLNISIRNYKKEQMVQKLNYLVGTLVD